ncbi:MAG: 3' terminal RNA ribose 2'-O-methyltransferase Hen1, partial [Cytophagales bacterium]|nr:3' terminal RNA ribose 2'-O-methyltransferase Hen1 [Cytophagales bacterium]
MLFTLTTTHRPATDLGYLLYKHPQKLQSVDLAAGKAHIFYPEATEDRCTVALLLDIDPVGLVRGGKFAAGDNFALEQYVNDRPYAASSFLSTAIAAAFGTAMNGTCRDKPELPETPLPFEATLTSVPARGGESLIRRLFEPLGYAIELTHHPLNTTFPDWGMSRYFTLTLRHRLRLRELLSHLYVLVPVLADDKHYFVSRHEVEKLLDKGQDWLPAHLEKELITKRYLKNLGHLTRQAFDVLMREEPNTELDEDDETAAPEPTSVREKRISL